MDVVPLRSFPRRQDGYLRYDSHPKFGIFATDGDAHIPCDFGTYHKADGTYPVIFETDDSMIQIQNLL